MPMSLRITLLAQVLLLAGFAFLARGLVKGRGTMPHGADRRICGALMVVSVALFLAAGVLMRGEQ